ncbi:DUF368 domain-containing protein [Virgibacillus sp. MG-45]|uniref:DUF368 domain-containing protein n=1 Tax=Virgibacillus sp. MG-45 TaxID=3102791 RepID=UPI002ED8F611
MEWKNIYRGLLMGASDVIPGVSGGTIALVLGIYDRLIEAINGFFGKAWKKHLGFLIPLGLGVGIAILTLSKAIDYLLEHYPGPLKFFFLGLILGVLPYLFHQAEARTTFKVKHVIILLIGALLIASIAFFDLREGAEMERGLSTYIVVFFSGILASAAMILPGISGSMILLVIGMYHTIINALSNLYLDIIAVTGIGVLIGIVLMSKVIKYFLDHYHTATFACVIGFVIGSLVIVFPGWPESMGRLFVSIATFAGGLLVAYILGRVEYKAS